MRKIPIVVILMLVVGFVCQAGFAAYAAIEKGSSSTETSVAPIQQQVETISETVISPQALDRLQQDYPNHYKSYVAMYRQLLIDLHVHPTMNQEIERLILQGDSFPDILIGYTFLYDHFGVIADLEQMISQKKSGSSWGSVFRDYNEKHEPFVPRAYDPDYLEKLMQTPSLTSDDIMIADQVSFASGTSFEDLIGAKAGTEHWKTLTADLGVVFSADTLPRVPITVEQLRRYTGKGGLSEDQVAQAFVIAYKTGTQAEDVMDRMKADHPIEEIYASIYMEKFHS